MAPSTTTSPIVIGTGLLALDVLVAGGPPALTAGGTCGNVIATLSWLGWNARPVARLNGDAAANAVRQDLSRFGVRLDLAEQAPTVPTPVIVERLRPGPDGAGVHRFSLTCPSCKTWLPRHQPVPARAIRELLESFLSTQVFFFDRLSRGALLLAERTAAEGGLVWFEPSKVDDQALFAEALAVTHVLKYSRERLPDLAARAVGRHGPLLEIETAGAQGLRYRGLGLEKPKRWRALPAVPAVAVVDTAGAGDWFSATLINQVGRSGLQGLEVLLGQDEAAVVHAVCRAQAASAVSCAFAGARGAMYALLPAAFAQRVDDRLAARPGKPEPEPIWPRGLVNESFCGGCDSFLEACART
jgi:fructokinase